MSGGNLQGWLIKVQQNLTRHFSGIILTCLKQQDLINDPNTQQSFMNLYADDMKIDKFKTKEFCKREVAHFNYSSTCTIVWKNLYTN